MTNNPYKKMKQNSIMTASPSELTLMLYEGAIKFANQAIIALENKDLEQAHNLIIRVQDIIVEFQVTLNTDYDVANNFEVMYDYIYRRLIEANIEKSIEILNEVLGYLREFRDTWKEAMRLVKQPEKKAL